MKFMKFIPYNVQIESSKKRLAPMKLAFEASTPVAEARRNVFCKHQGYPFYQPAPKKNKRVKSDDDEDGAYIDNEAEDDDEADVDVMYTRAKAKMEGITIQAEKNRLEKITIELDEVVFNVYFIFFWLCLQ